MKTYNVAVFVSKTENSKRKFPYQCTAYLRDYNTEWPGHNNVKIMGENGQDAKKRALRIIKTQLSFCPRIVNVSTQ